MGRFSEALLESEDTPTQGPEKKSSFSDSLLSPPKPEAKPATKKGFSIDSVSDLVMSAMSPSFFATPGEHKSFARGVENVGEGFVQFGMDGLELAGILEPGTTSTYTKKTLNERRIFAENLKQQFGDKLSFKINEATGEILPYFLIPAAKFASIPARVGTGAAVGGATGATSFQEGVTTEERGEGRAVDAGVGAAFGGVVSYLMELGPAIKNFAKKHLAPDLNPSAIKQLEKQGRAAGIKEYEGLTDKIKQQKFVQGQADKALKISELTGTKLKLSQIVDDPSLEAMEQFARASHKGERAARAFERNQPRQVFNYFKRIQRKISPKMVGGKPTKEVVPFPDRVHSAFNDVMGEVDKGTGLLGSRAKRAKVNFAKAAVEDSAIPLKATKVELETMISKLESVPRFKGQDSLLRELKGFQKDMNEWVLNPVQLQNLLEGWGKASKGGGKLFRDLDSAATRGPAKNLFRALSKDLDDAAEQPGAKLLRKARDQYREDSALIDVVEDSAIGALFGKAGKVDPEDIGSAFVKMKPSEIKSTMDILSKSDPSLQKSLQRFWLQEHIKKAQVSGESGWMEFVPGKLLDLKQKGAREAYKAVFNDTQSRKLVRDGLEAVRLIMKNNQTSGGRSLPKIKELAGVLASRDSTFVARLSAELFAPELVAKYALHPEGVKALKVLSLPFNQNSATAALVTLNDIMRREQITEEQ